jgi:hypothetical protein
MSYVNCTIFEKDGAVYAQPALDITAIYNAAFAAGKAEGVVEGKAEGVAECAAKHFVTTIQGSGTGTLEIKGIPFDPDFLEIHCYSGTLDECAVGFATMDLRSPTLYCGAVGVFNQKNGMVISGSSTAGLSGTTARYKRSEDGTITLANLKASFRQYSCKHDATGLTYQNIIYDGIFHADNTYIVTAVKYTE